MADNCFSLAAKSCIARKLTAKEYLMQVEGKTEEEANAILAELAESGSGG